MAERLVDHVSRCGSRELGNLCHEARDDAVHFQLEVAHENAYREFRPLVVWDERFQDVIHSLRAAQRNI